MRDFDLNIGEVAVHAKPAVYVVRGLGSCVGLFLLDRVTGHSGGAHIFLPQSDLGNFNDGKYYSVTAALDELQDRLSKMGSNLNCLRAKIVGGANVLNSKIDVGVQNVNAVINQLVERKIFIAASDIGGNYCRTAHFYSQSGELSVRASSTCKTKTYLI